MQDRNEQGFPKLPNGLYACCADPENLYRPSPYEGVLRCRVCERRHFKLDVDPATFDARGAEI